MEKYIKVTDLLNSKLIFPGFPSELQKEEIEKLSLGCMPESEIKGGFLIIEGDEINSFLIAALRSLNPEQLIVLRDKLIRRTPKDDRIDKAIEWCQNRYNEVNPKDYAAAYYHLTYDKMKEYLQSLNQ